MDTIIREIKRERWRLIFSFLIAAGCVVMGYDYAVSQGFSEGFVVLIGIAVFLTALVSISEVVGESSFES